MPDPATEATGRRIGAAVIDLVPLFLLFVVVGVALGEDETDENGVSITLEGGEALIYFALALGYYVLTELTLKATLGKRLLGLEVVGADGGPASAGGIVARNVLRVVDGLPFLYLVGLVTMLVTQRKQRVGDLVGGTIVVRRGAAAAQPPPGQPPGPPPAPPPAASAP